MANKKKKEITMPLETVEVPVQWFVRMLEVKALAEAQIKKKNVSPEGLMWLVHLFGYLQSAEGYTKIEKIK